MSVVEHMAVRLAPGHPIRVMPPTECYLGDEVHVTSPAWILLVLMRAPVATSEFGGSLGLRRGVRQRGARL